MQLTTFLLVLFLIPIKFHSQEIITPKGYSILQEIEGDLNKDSIPEKVIVYNTSDSSDFGFIREIQVHKKENKKWILIEKSRNAVLKSEEGGAFGDPFESINIKNGILIINHFGGSNWKWKRTDKYRYNGEIFELIGITNTNGMDCEHWETVDFNLISGKINYTKKFEKCSENHSSSKIYKTENENFIKKGIQLNLKNRNLTENTLITPKLKKNIYF